MKFRADKSRRRWVSGEYAIERRFWGCTCTFVVFHRGVRFGATFDLRGDRGAMAMCRRHAEGVT